VKAAVLGQLLAGRSDAELRSAGRRHATWIERTRLRHDTVARLAWHRAQGHTTVIVSASLHHYLDPVAEALGIDHVLCTDLEVEHGRLTGRLVGGNCRRAAKAERLLAWTGGLPHELWAYGDSSGDCELLALADHPVSVRGVHLLADPAAVAG
jgi:phosphatidylglycerophosphatase C